MQITGGIFTGGISLGAPVVPPVSTQNWAFSEDSSQFSANADYRIEVITSWTVDRPNNIVWASLNEYNFLSVAGTAPNVYSSGSIINNVKQMSNAEITALLVNMPVGTNIDMRQNGTANLVAATFVSGSLGWFGSDYRLRLTVNEDITPLGNYCGIMVKYTSNALNTLAITS